MVLGRLGLREERVEREVEVVKDYRFGDECAVSYRCFWELFLVINLKRVYVRLNEVGISRNYRFVFGKWG